MQCKKCEQARQWTTSIDKKWIGYYECSLCGGLGKFEKGLSNFIDGYLECSLWSSVTDDPNGITDEHCFDDIHPDTLVAMQADCKAFFEAHGALWADAIGYSDPQAGHDFWLTRNRHGAGFWDREEIKQTSQLLFFLSTQLGEFHLELCDDNLIHGSK